MKRKLELAVSICAALVGLSAMLFGVSHFSVMAEQPAAPAAAIVVDTLDDDGLVDGDCSLREAIQAANTNAGVDACPAGDGVVTDTITFNMSGMITVTNQLSVAASGPLVIDGGGSITISGGGSVQIMSVSADADLALKDLSLLNGASMWSTGGISNFGTLEIVNCILSGNSAGPSGGGAIYNGGTLYITNSTLSGNGYVQYGGAIDNNGTLYITNSTLSDNNADDGGAIYNDSALYIANSTLSDNTANYGGGVYNNGIMTVTNSTLSGNNTANYGGAILNGSSGTLIVMESTLSGNSAVDGGGLYNAGGSITVGSSIIANSPSGGNCSGPLYNDGGYNLEDADTCDFDPANGFLPNTDPLLGPLQDNGGPTWTFALLAGSPAIDAGNPVSCLATDQRGIPRPLDGNGDGEAVCDIGAYEFQQGIDLFPNSQSGSGVPSTYINYNIQLYNWTSITDTYGLTLGSHTWETELSESQIENLEPGENTTFTVTVLIPVDSDWYETDSVVLTATSQTSPTVFYATAQLTTIAYAPPQISVEPLSLESTQYANQVITQPLTINNGNGVTLTHSIAETVSWLSVEPQFSSVPTNSSQEVSVTFDSTAVPPGVYETTLLINSNDPLKPFIEVPATMTVASIAPLSVEIAGSQDGLVGEAYTFTATVSPISTTLPVEYAWQATGQQAIIHTGWLSDTLAFTWDSPGTQVITITATNSGGAVTSSHTIDISEVPISGLTISSDSPILLGAPTAFTATIDAGTNVSYAWDFGDESQGAGATAKHTYAAAGVYTATVTASNSIGSLQASTVVTVVSPETKVYLPVIQQKASPIVEAVYWRRQE